MAVQAAAPQGLRRFEAFDRIRPCRGHKKQGTFRVTALVEGHTRCEAGPQNHSSRGPAERGLGYPKRFNEARMREHPRESVWPIRKWRRRKLATRRTRGDASWP